MLSIPHESEAQSKCRGDASISSSHSGCTTQISFVLQEGPLPLHQSGHSQSKAQLEKWNPEWINHGEALQALTVCPSSSSGERWHNAESRMGVFSWGCIYVPPEPFTMDSWSLLKENCVGAGNLACGRKKWRDTEGSCKSSMKCSPRSSS